MPDPQSRIPRRVVTGHDDSGASVVLSDGHVPVYRHLEGEGVGFYEVWQTEDAPTRISGVEPSEPTQRTLRVPPPVRGTKIRINEFLPGHLNDLGNQSPMHRTETIDYGIVLEGEIVLVLDDSEVTLHAGDVVVQRGTDHAWANRSDSVARVAFILIDGEFSDDLLEKLPTGVRDTLMHEGPAES